MLACFQAAVLILVRNKKNTIPAQRFTAGKFDHDFIPTVYHFKLCHQEYEETHSS